VTRDADERTGEREPLRGPVARAVGTPILANSEAFGFSITITVTYGVASRFEGQPSLAAVFLFAVCAALSLGVFEAAVTRGFTRRVDELAPEVRMLGTAQGVISVTAGLAAAYGVVRTLDGIPAWALAPAAAVAVFIAAEIGESLVAEVIQRRREGAARADEEA
jgi:hypothetical protein